MLFVCYKEYLEVNPVLLGGASIIVEVDESVLSHRGIIINPTSTGDTRDTIRILGGLDKTNESNFFMVCVLDRTFVPLTDAIVSVYYK